MNRKILFVFFSAIFIFCVSAYSQYDSTIEFSYKGFKFVSQWDTANYYSVFTISKDGKIIEQDTISDRLESIGDYDLEGKGQRLIVASFFTGGAHCCTYLTAAALEGDNYVIKDSLFLGDAGCEIKDIDNDGVMELNSVDTRFGYAFTNFAESQFPIIIYQYRNGKFIDATKKFPDLVKKDLEAFKQNLKNDFLNKGFECPKKAGDDTFNTEAGSVKAYLAAILEDYYNLNKILEGYDYIDKTYTCPDAKNFVYTLKDDFKLK